MLPTFWAQNVSGGEALLDGGIAQSVSRNPYECVGSRDSTYDLENLRLAMIQREIGRCCVIVNSSSDRTVARGCAISTEFLTILKEA